MNDIGLKLKSKAEMKKLDDFETTEDMSEDPQDDSPTPSPKRKTKSKKVGYRGYQLQSDMNEFYEAMFNPKVKEKKNMIE